ncbi:cholesteryl ester transfer protein isoform X2 [Fukomys damarensis]|uniref:Cholesteryl ester transfer protein n=1 Tax=Fukomys damarensis TaxID=885580 RepID=A0A091DVX6_FUKDA|nr:cholesteryl ester transfer protein isoform X2 [Fukomys damarensis]KFO26961.1 Cholesteryl ester transfer protein [Fukomys damarensis]
MLAAALLSLALLDSVHACSTSPPSAVGIVCRITKPAFLVLNQETAKVIQTAFQRASYPDIKGEKAVVLLGHIKYGLHNIQISHLTIASSQVELAEAKSIDISIQNVSVIFKGTLNYGYMSAWGLSINQSVGFEIDSAIDLQINTQLICDSGRVRTDALDCHLSFHKLLLNLHGEHEPGWIKRLFTNFISFTLQLVLKGQVCKEISVISNGMADFVQSRAASILSDGDIGVDISLTGLPIITATYLESHHKGCFIYKNVSEDLILPAFSPSLLGDSRMLYFWFSEQVLDSLAKAAFQDGRLTLNLTGDKFKLFSSFPLSQAQVTVHCLTRPRISCQNKGVVVSSSVMVKFLFPHPDGRHSVAHSFEEDIITTIQASYSQKKLFLSLLDFQITPKTASNESESSSKAVRSFLKLMITSVGIPEVMSRLQVALTILMNSKGLHFFDIINPEIIPQDGSLLLQMDFGFPEHLLVDFLQSLN